MNPKVKVLVCVLAICVPSVAATSAESGEKSRDKLVSSRHNEFDNQWVHLAAKEITLIKRPFRFKVKFAAVDNYEDEVTTYFIAMESQYSECVDVKIIKWKVDGDTFETEAARSKRDRLRYSCITEQSAKIEEDLWVTLANPNEVKLRIETDEGFKETTLDSEAIALIAE